MKRGFCLFVSLVLVLLAGTALADTAAIDGGKKAAILFPAPTNDTAKAIGRYYTGTEAELLSVEGDWAKVTVGAETGYMKTDSLKMGEEAEQTADGSAAAVVTADDFVNLRAKPSTEAKVVRRLPKGEEMQVLGELPGRWRYVQAGNDFGYVLDHFIKVYDSALSEAVVSAGESGVLMLYSKPGSPSEAQTLGLFYNGTPVRVIGEKGEWCQVRIGGQEGWALKSQLVPAGEKQVISPEYRTGKVNSASGLNLRRSPSSAEEKIKTLKDGTFVYVMGEMQSGWYYVMVGEDVGYVNAKFVQMDND